MRIRKFPHHPTIFTWKNMSAAPQKAPRLRPEWPETRRRRSAVGRKGSIPVCAADEPRSHVKIERAPHSNRTQSPCGIIRK